MNTASRQGRPGWRDYFIGVAYAVAMRGDCTRRQIGAVLVRPDHTVASVGYNGAAPGYAGCLTDGACPRATSNVPPGSSYDTGPGSCNGLHAEQNCVAFAREDTAGYTMYLTAEPCTGCMRTMRAHRLGRVVWPDGEAVVYESPSAQYTHHEASSRNWSNILGSEK